MNKSFTLEKLFDSFPGGICVPRIQRGYVQGREDGKGKSIRAEFVPVLVKAVFGNSPLSLDFLYGVADGTEEKRRLLPLDGQQRLTTLALLAWLCGKWRKEWRFDYESRRVPQLFMKGLLGDAPPTKGKPTDAVRASSWFLPDWESDPSVAGMLRMLNALDENIGSRDRMKANLGNVTFLLHGIVGTGDTFDHIFRKMNARGKELSPWENMKAVLDKHLDKSLPKEMAEDWRDKIDGGWAECIWKGVGGNIVKLDNALEKIVRMAYARVAGLDKQDETLWQMDNKLSSEGEDALSKTARSNFFQFATAYFNALSKIAGCWSEDRTKNALWGTTDDETGSTDAVVDFWEWLSNGHDASLSDILRISFLAEESHCADDSRRRRILLNLLDASSIEDKCEGALKAGLDFLAAKLDLDGLEARKAGYSPAQLADEKRKWKLNADRVVKFEQNDLVYCGSLRFIGWSDFVDEADVQARLEKVKAAIDADWIGIFCKILARLERGDENELKSRVAIPYSNLRRWGEHVLSTNQVIKAIAEMETGIPEPEWPDWLQHFKQLAQEERLGNNYGLRAFDGWTYVVADVSRSRYSIRLDYNAKEKENRKLLDGEIIYYETDDKRWLPRAAKICDTGYDVWDASWYETTNPQPVPLVTNDTK